MIRYTITGKYGNELKLVKSSWAKGGISLNGVRINTKRSRFDRNNSFNDHTYIEYYTQDAITISDQCTLTMRDLHTMQEQMEHGGIYSYMFTLAYVFLLELMKHGEIRPSFKEDIAAV